MTVVREKEVIKIVPADPQIIYVPQYNPQVVVVKEERPAAPLITFTSGLILGSSNTVMHGTPPENVLAIRDTANTCGRCAQEGQCQ